jgi:hypothetical protein
VFDEKVLHFKSKTESKRVGNSYVHLEIEKDDCDDELVGNRDPEVNDLFDIDMDVFEDHQNNDNVDDEREMEDYVVEPEVPVLRRSERIRKHKVCSCCNLTICNVDPHISDFERPMKPMSAVEAMSSDESSEWTKAMLEEIQHLNEKGVYVLVERPKNQRVLGSMWVLKRKLGPDGNVSRYRVAFSGFRLCSESRGRLW